MHLDFPWDFSILVSGPGSLSLQEGPALWEQREAPLSVVTENPREQGGNYRLAVAAAPGWAVSTLAKKHSWKVTPGSKPPQESRRQPFFPSSLTVTLEYPWWTGPNKEQLAKQSLSLSITRLPPRWPHPVWNSSPRYLALSTHHLLQPLFSPGRWRALGHQPAGGTLPGPRGLGEGLPSWCVTKKQHLVPFDVEISLRKLRLIWKPGLCSIKGGPKTDQSKILIIVVYGSFTSCVLWSPCCHLPRVPREN